MDNNKYRKFYVEWWKIRRSTIYAAIGLMILAGAAYFGFRWASQNNWFIASENIEIPQDAAKIIAFEGEVRITRAATRETILVTKETYVAAGDTILTMADGRAMIQMIDKSVYTMRPNSALVVEQTTSLLGGKNVRVSLGDGQLNVRTDDQPLDAKNIVEVAETENQLLPKTDASFNADSQTNGGEIRISRGGVETTIGGEKTLIGANEFAAVNDGKLSSREKLFAAPQAVSPANSEQIIAPDNSANVTFNWQDADGNPAVSYYLQVSSSPIFASDAILVDRNNMSGRSFRLAGLAPGTYYWRVKSTARSGQTTNWNDTWKFLVVRSGDSVTIEASEWKSERIGGTVYLISGKTSPGMLVRVQGRETYAGPDGRFQLQVASPSVEMPVEISDDRGNRSGFIISLRSGKVLRHYK